MVVEAELWEGYCLTNYHTLMTMNDNMTLMYLLITSFTIITAHHTLSPCLHVSLSVSSLSWRFLSVKKVFCRRPPKAYQLVCWPNQLICVYQAVYQSISSTQIKYGHAAVKLHNPTHTQWSIIPITKVHSLSCGTKTQQTALNPAELM